MPSAPSIVRIDARTGAPDAVSVLLASLSTGESLVAIYDELDFLRYANDGFLRAFNLKAGDVATFASIIIRSFREKVGVRIQAHDAHSFIEDSQTRRRVPVQHPRQRSFPVDFTDDQWFWCTETLMPNGWIVLSGTNITSLKQAEGALQAAHDQALFLSQVDELTGVPNRRCVLRMLAKLMNDSAADETTLSVALLDLDGFKNINDTFGHEAGDCVLRDFAAHCVATAGRHHHVGRLGGEEFVVLFPRIAATDAKDALEKMLATVPPVEVDGGFSAPVKVSFSAGITEVKEGERPEDALARADKALYRAKLRGRHRVEI
ncbi:hypothetical protein CR51_35945 [Caballeronia megalochromosomata]|nr:hypothetical protein CR51_35945 [Caballeronia megalochromosomata]